MRGAYYVLFEASGIPAFMVGEDDTPQKFHTAESARQLASVSTLGRAFGYAILEWPDGTPELARVVETHPPSK